MVLSSALRSTLLAVLTTLLSDFDLRLSFLSVFLADVGRRLVGELFVADTIQLDGVGTCGCGSRELSDSDARTCATQISDVDLVSGPEPFVSGIDCAWRGWARVKSAGCSGSPRQAATASASTPCESTVADCRESAQSPVFGPSLLASATDGPVPGADELTNDPTQHKMFLKVCNMTQMSTNHDLASETFRQQDSDYGTVSHLHSGAVPSSDRFIFLTLLHSRGC